MNILILTAHTSNILYDNYGHCDYNDYSSINHIKYCNKNNYSYLNKIFDETKLEYHPTWIKITAILEELDNYDYIAWIDSDAIFCTDLKIEDLIIGTEDIVIPKHELDTANDIMWTTTTTGFVIFKNSDYNKNLLRYMLDNMGECRYGHFHEQTILDIHLRDIFLANGYENLANIDREDISDNILISNIHLLKRQYHICNLDEPTLFIYHSSGNLYTKKTRLEEYSSKFNI